MGDLREYVIPIYGLSKGVHQFEFSLKKEFFENFENSPIQVSDLDTKVFLDKRDNMITIALEYTGSIHVACDRCLEMIDLPVRQSHSLLIKYADDKLDNDGEDIIYVDRDESHLQLAPFLYEFACLSTPIANVYDCEDDENAPCSDEILDILNQGDERSASHTTSLGDQLKNLNLNL